MYRAITLYFIRNNINLSDQQGLTEALKNIRIEFLPNLHDSHTELWLNGENVKNQIREITVAEKVSEVAALREVRKFAVNEQQILGRKKGIVMDGRDIGTVVFPNAELKLFLTADISTRVERRFNELQNEKNHPSREEVKENLVLRDYKDTHREISPLKKADDAIVLDNSNLSREQQLDYALNLANKIIEEKLVLNS